MDVRAEKAGALKSFWRIEADEVGEFVTKVGGRNRPG